MKSSENFFIQAEPPRRILQRSSKRVSRIFWRTRFNKSEDQQAFNQQIDSIARLQAELQGHAKEAEEHFKP